MRFNDYNYHLFDFFRADSITFNPHKMLTAPQQCSVFLTKHENIMNSCHSCSAQYLFQKDKFYDTRYDTGDKHIQCGRRADVLKFWLMWKAKVSIGEEEEGWKTDAQMKCEWSTGFRRSGSSRRSYFRNFFVLRREDSE